MNISIQDWLNYINKMTRLSEIAGQKMQEYVERHGFDDREALIDYAHAVVTKYGEGSAELACQMYDAIAEFEKVTLAAAVPADIPTYNDVAKAINGVLKQSPSGQLIDTAVKRMVKLTGADTTLKNAIRDKAQFAWIPHGDTCAFCIAIASRGWQDISANALKNGHAEHIHANCDCEYAIRHNMNTEFEGYDPKEYADMYYSESGSSQDKINAMRRKYYAENKERINVRKRELYALTKPVKKEVTAEDINKIATDALTKQYKHRVDDLGVKFVPYDELNEASKPVANLTKMDKNLAEATAKQFSKLSSEYESMCQEITVDKFDPLMGSVPAATNLQLHIQQASMSFNQNIMKNRESFLERMKKAVERNQFPIMDESEYEKYVVTHEFVHTLMDMKSPLKNYVDGDTKNIAAARKEITKIWNDYNAKIKDLTIRQNDAELEAISSFEVSVWDKARKLSDELKAARISHYAENSIDEFMAEAFTDAKLGSNPTEHSKRVEAVIDKYFGKKPVANDTQSSKIKVTKTISGHSGTPKVAEPNAIIDHINKDGVVDARSFHDAAGIKQKDIHTTNHGNPKEHNYGENGEHGHDYDWNDDGSLKNKTTRELTPKERKENSDIL